jgi:hypothetical protein
MPNKTETEVKAFERGTKGPKEDDPGPESEKDIPDGRRKDQSGGRCVV